MEKSILRTTKEFLKAKDREEHARNELSRSKEIMELEKTILLQKLKKAEGIKEELKNLRQKMREYDVAVSHEKRKLKTASKIKASNTKKEAKAEKLLGKIEDNLKSLVAHEKLIEKSKAKLGIAKNRFRDAKHAVKSVKRAKTARHPIKKTKISPEKNGMKNTFKKDDNDKRAEDDPNQDGPSDDEKAADAKANSSLNKTQSLIAESARKLELALGQEEGRAPNAKSMAAMTSKTRRSALDAITGLKDSIMKKIIDRISSKDKAGREDTASPNMNEAKHEPTLDKQYDKQHLIAQNIPQDAIAKKIESKDNYKKDDDKDNDKSNEGNKDGEELDIEQMKKRLADLK